MIYELKITPLYGQPYTAIVPIPAQLSDTNKFLNEWVDKNIKHVISWQIQTVCRELHDNMKTIKDFFKSDKWTNDDFESFTNILISADILESGIMNSIDSTIVQMTEEEIAKFAEIYEEKLKCSK